MELDLSDYVTKPGLKNATGVDTSQFAKRLDLAKLKVEVDKLDIDKLEKAPSGLNNLKSIVDELDVDKLAQQVPTDLSNLSHGVENDVVEKAVYDELIKKVNSIDTSKLVKKQTMIITLVILKLKYLILLT